ncbi:MAG TPA: secondary thiamine-phosphate synthase enzyme YjbQ [Longimicrobium sp.]|jgi:secondary thiamine-phosphate synthase enzyme
MEEIRVRTGERNALVEITAQVEAAVRRTGVRAGIVVVQSLHTTAALTVNENADPDVVHDVLRKMDEIVPATERYYRHAEGNSDSHVKTSLFGPSLTLIVHDGAHSSAAGRASTCASGTARARGRWRCR